MNDHISSSFNADLADLNTLTVSMGGMTIAQLVGVLDALRHNPDSIDTLIKNDRNIDNLEAEINTKVVEIIASRAPVAKDLRVVLTSLKIAQMLERIGDFACSIGKRSRQFNNDQAVMDLQENLNEMSDLAISMLIDVVDALKHSDVGKALSVWQGDINLDMHYHAIYKAIITKMDEGEIPASTGTQLIISIKNLERIGDYTTGIAEQVYFRINGEDIEGRRPKKSTA